MGHVCVQHDVISGQLGSFWRLQTELSTDLYAFIATVKLDNDGDNFHENADVIYEKYGPQRLREFLDETIQMLKDFQEENAGS